MHDEACGCQKNREIREIHEIYDGGEAEQGGGDEAHAERDEQARGQLVGEVAAGGRECGHDGGLQEQEESRFARREAEHILQVEREQEAHGECRAVAHHRREVREAEFAVCAEKSQRQHRMAAARNPFLREIAPCEPPREGGQRGDEHEDAAPAKVVVQEAAEERPCREAEVDDGDVRAEREAAVLFRHDECEDGHAGRKEHGCKEPLQRAHDDERTDAGGKCADDVRRCESCEAQEIDAALAIDVGGLSHRQQAEGARDEVGRENPGEDVRPCGKLRADARQRERQCARGERGEERGKHDGKKNLSFHDFLQIQEKRDFELSIQVSPYTRFPGVLLQPLGQLSKCSQMRCYSVFVRAVRSQQKLL